MRQHKFCPDKQQYINAKLFSVYIVAIERQKTIANVLNQVWFMHLIFLYQEAYYLLNMAYIDRQLYMFMTSHYIAAS